MDLTTRRCEDGEVVNGKEQCRGFNGTSDVTGVIEVSRKSSSFSIRSLVGGEDSDRPADGHVNTPEALPVLLRTCASGASLLTSLTSHFLR
ncbi:Paired family homeodomain transcription factor [Danaus plexippus plexippus]|uniref:Paired family homeodomain transcription factor n=1 Tax=Danaus plexippus plexippus TaxID=278856 RepID=A0A212EWG4_DANPL|nr:Paired family homeodomain transcription factor [Danaus plexippus plexippus]